MANLDYIRKMKMLTRLTIIGIIMQVDIIVDTVDFHNEPPFLKIKK